MDLRLELMIIPVTDVDRAKQFYVEQAGFVADHDVRVSDTLRFVQLTPPGSACSIAVGEGITDGVPGEIGTLQLVVDDIEQAVKNAEAQGAVIAYPPTRQGARGVFAIVIQGNVQHGLWQQMDPSSGSPSEESR